MEQIIITIGENKLIAVDYWWEENDFIFLTNSGEKHCLKNLYIKDIKFDGLDYSPIDDLILIGKKWEPNGNYFNYNYWNFLVSFNQNYFTF